MSPVQIWVLAFFRSLMDRPFNNADSFAMVFDDAWKKLVHNSDFKALTTDEKIAKSSKHQLKTTPFFLIVLSKPYKLLSSECGF